MIYKALERVELKPTRYAILDGIADILLSSSSIWEAGFMPMEYPGVNLKELYEIVMHMFPRKEVLMTEKNCTIWNYLLKFSVDMCGFRDLDIVLGC